MNGIRASPAQLEALHALAAAGDMKGAAALLGISLTAVERRIRKARARNDQATTYQLVYGLGRQTQGDTEP